MRTELIPAMYLKPGALVTINESSVGMVYHVEPSNIIGPSCVDVSVLGCLADGSVVAGSYRVASALAVRTVTP